MISRIAIAAFILTLASCSSETAVPTPEFLTQRSDINSWPLSAITGTVIVHEGCLSIAPTHSGKPLALVIPYGYALRVERDSVFVVDQQGNAWVEAGREANIGGGPITDDAKLQSFIGTNRVASKCRSPAWLALPKFDRP